MPALVGVGKGGTTKKFTAVVNPGTALTFAVPVKSFLIKPIGGTVYFKFNSTDADADAYPIGNGEAIQMDISSRYPIASNTATVGVIFTASGSVDVYTLVGC